MRLKLSNLRTSWAALIKGKERKTTNPEIDDIEAREAQIEKMQNQDGLSREEAKRRLTPSRR